MKALTKTTALLGVFTTLALALAFLEFLLPPIYPAIPGIKLGLPNLVIIFLLYKKGLRAAITVSALRIVLAALLFGSLISALYSLAGAFLSLLVMFLLKRTNSLSAPIVSVLGAVAHNIGQLIVAAIMLYSAQIFYYLPVLLLSAVISGALIGIAATLLLKSLKHFKL